MASPTPAIAAWPRPGPGKVESPRHDETRGAGSRFTLPALLLLAFVLRAAAAALTGIHHPDAVYQYLEPAHRLLTGEGAVTWEWRVGMRGWLLPWLFTAPIAGARALLPGSGLDVFAARLLVALASLGPVWAAWSLGARMSRQAAIAGAFVAATWFELVYFGAQTLSESLATAALLPAAALLGRHDARGLLGAGVLLSLAVLARPQYVPAAAVLAGARLWAARGEGHAVREGSRIALGGLIALVAGAAADIAAGAPPLAWIVENVRQNLLLGKAAGFGLSPWYAYLLWLCGAWRWAAVPILLGAWRGRAACPPLFWAALAHLAAHSALGHKEYRFVEFTAAALVILAAIGWAEAARRARWPLLAVLGLAAAGSASLALTSVGWVMIRQWRESPALAAIVARDPAACGVALADVDWSRFPGQVGLGKGRTLQLFAPDDPAMRGRPDALARAAPTYDYLVLLARRSPPPGYARVTCIRDVGAPAICLWHRPGGCERAASPFDINAALDRLSRAM